MKLKLLFMLLSYSHTHRLFFLAMQAKLQEHSCVYTTHSLKECTLPNVPFFFLLCLNCFTLLVAEEHGSKPGNVKLAVWRKCTPYARTALHRCYNQRGIILLDICCLWLEDKQPSSYLLDNVGTKIIKRSFNSSTMKKAGTIQASKYSRLIRRLLKKYYSLFVIWTDGLVQNVFFYCIAKD